MARVGGGGPGGWDGQLLSLQPPILTKIHDDLIILADGVIAPHHPILQHGCAIEAHAPCFEVAQRIKPLLRVWTLRAAMC